MNSLDNIRNFFFNSMGRKRDIADCDHDEFISQILKKINAYCEPRPVDERMVVFGGHWSTNPGFLVLTEEEQDLCKPLAFDDSSLSFIFTEHVIEHLDFLESVQFFTEAYRVLAPGGVMRTVCPMLDVLLNVDFQNSQMDAYANSSIYSTFANEFDVIKRLGVDVQSDDLKTFFMNSMFNRHGHKFIWSYGLLKSTLEGVGFREAKICKVGEGKFPDRCIERRRRGIYLGNDYREELASQITIDVESGVIEVAKSAA